MARIMETLRTMYDYVIVDLGKRLDDHSLDVVTAADTLLVVMNAGLSCIKNVRLVQETMAQIRVPEERVEFFMNRSNAFHGHQRQVRGRRAAPLAAGLGRILGAAVAACPDLIPGRAAELADGSIRTRGLPGEAL